MIPARSGRRHVLHILHAHAVARRRRRARGAPTCGELLARRLRT